MSFIRSTLTPSTPFGIGSFMSNASPSGLNAYNAFLFTVFSMNMLLPDFRGRHERGQYAGCLLESVCHLLQAGDRRSVRTLVNDAQEFVEGRAQAAGFSGTLEQIFSFYDVFVPLTMTFAKVMSDEERCICSGHVTRSEFPVLPLDTLGLDCVHTVEQAAVLTMAQPRVVGWLRCARRPPSGPGRCNARYRHDVTITLGPVVLLSATRSEHHLELSQAMELSPAHFYYLSLVVVQGPERQFLVRTRPGGGLHPHMWIQYDTATGAIRRIPPGHEGSVPNSDWYICLYGYICTSVSDANPQQVASQFLYDRLRTTLQYDPDDIIVRGVPVVRIE